MQILQMDDFLQLFADGGTGSGEGVSESAAVAQPQNTGEETEKSQSDTEAQGSESENPQSAAGSDAGEAPKKSFDELINSDYKEDFTKRVSEIIGKRTAGINKQMQSQDLLLGKLMARLGIESTDELTSMLENEDEAIRVAAEKGIDLGTLKDLETMRSDRIVGQMQSERAKVQQEAERAYIEARTLADAQVERWQSEAAQVKAVYPGFDLVTELKNPQFRSLIQTKNPQYAIKMIDAYRMLHYDDLQKSVQTSAAEAVTKSIESRQVRPDENGLTGGSGVNFSGDVHAMTKKDRAELAKRAARGEVIKL